jgi:hypothetical protein
VVDFAEKLAVSSEIRLKVPAKTGSLATRTVQAGGVTELRLIHETAVVHPDALLEEVLPLNYTSLLFVF